MTIDEKIKQAAIDYQARHADKSWIGSNTKWLSKAHADGANFVKSEMLADMQKLVDALEFTIKESGTSTNYNHKCREALAEFNAKYKGEK